MAKKLVYFANNRLPTEKAHGLQIVQMSEAFANAGYDVTLIAPDRFNTPEMRAIDALWNHYGVAQNFAFRRLPCLDLFPIFPRFHVALLLQTITYIFSILIWLLFRRVDVLYTRDMFIGFVLVLFRPKTTLIYEVHQVHGSRFGQRVQGVIVCRAYVVPITGHIAEKIRALGADRIQVEHDGFRAARFAALPVQVEARAEVSWPVDAAFIVGWIGRLHMLGLDKGVGQLGEALVHVPDSFLAIVGGPDSMVEMLRERWIAAGLDGARFLAAGQVLPDRVPVYLRAFDVCVMPHPWTEQFAYYTSPIKLFEYMASGRAIVASDLPAFAEVLHHEHNALLVSPDDVNALAAAIRRLQADYDLRARLGAQAQDDAQHYTWDARALRIRAFVERKV
ncbi:MAG: glycosyltransferase family 4 protein [Anaerolineae bacterium]|nr:glycosyltransferase family 4 protein [Anaerolineae bacterium]